MASVIPGPDYSKWSKVRLIGEIQMLREGLHQARREATNMVNKLQRRLSFIERTRDAFHG